MLNRWIKWTSILAIGVFFIVLIKYNTPLLSTIPWWDWNIFHVSILWPLVVALYLTPITFFIGVPIVDWLDRHLTKPQ